LLSACTMGLLTRTPSLIRHNPLSSIPTYDLVQPLSRLHRRHRYIEMLIAIPTLGYLRLYR
jgi:hypothetical protein